MSQRIRPFAWVLLAILAMSSATAALAVMHGYTPISKLDRSHQFKLKKICNDKAFKDNTVTKVAGYDMTLIDDGENLSIVILGPPVF